MCYGGLCVGLIIGVGNTSGTKNERGLDHPRFKGPRKPTDSDKSRPRRSADVCGLFF
ncbi:MAG: hypothetical protein J5784_02470 [Muribaculaceae bacterium]|nr:hypothetical protein [Muribaculaceae bacterium]